LKRSDSKTVRNREAVRRWRELNRERQRGYFRRWRDSHREVHRSIRLAQACVPLGFCCVLRFM
jgi:hypothetical protein